MIRLLNVTLKVREKVVYIPLITLFSESLGIITRIAGGIFEPDISSVIGREVSGTGQIPAEDLKKSLANIICISLIKSVFVVYIKDSSVIFIHLILESLKESHEFHL